MLGLEEKTYSTGYSSSFMGRVLEKDDLSMFFSDPKLARSDIVAGSCPEFKESMRIINECKNQYDAIASKYPGAIGTLANKLGLSSPEKGIRKKVAKLEKTIHKMENVKMMGESIMNNMQEDYYQAIREKHSEGIFLEQCGKYIGSIDRELKRIDESYQGSKDLEEKIGYEIEKEKLIDDKYKLESEQEKHSANVIMIDDYSKSLSASKDAARGFYRTTSSMLNAAITVKHEIETMIPANYKGAEAMKHISKMHSQMEGLKDNISRVSEANLKMVSELTKYQVNPKDVKFASRHMHDKEINYKGKINSNLKAKKDGLLRRAKEILENDRNKGLI